MLNFIIMKKVTKASFNRSVNSQTPNYNNFMCSRKQPHEDNQIQINKPMLWKNNSNNMDYQYLGKKSSDEGESHEALQNLMEKKIQIDSNLLFNYNCYSRDCNRVERVPRKKDQYKRNFSETATDYFQYRSQQRPQSKQQARSKVWGTGSRIMPRQESDRPQTSKGARISLTRHQKRQQNKTKLQDNDDIEVEIKKSMRPLTNKSKRMKEMKKIELQTSIDPEFLALFAS